MDRILRPQSSGEKVTMQKVAVKKGAVLNNVAVSLKFLNGRSLYS